MNIQNTDFIRKLKADIIIISIILTAAFLFFFVPYLINKDQINSEVVIIQDGEELYRYRLAENRTVTIQGTDQSYNLLLISEGKVRVTDADCPDKLCIRQKSISKNGESIICLPHKLVILIDSPEESDLDAVTN